MAYSIAQAESLSELLGGQAKVALAMRYGKPSIESVLDDVFAKGHRRVLLLPPIRNMPRHLREQSLTH